ncbi:hypothetical protein [Catellatospora vulcania]|uniref:hypothetical protein n=1 Tax=Catellatospora vulcania TaxID=1460450 RepID=UPI0012D48154|nr:hypothetical protein [Catellatospora vulcania]
MSIIAVPVGVGLLNSDSVRPQRPDFHVLGVALVAIWCTVCATLAVRAARQGVYARPAHLQLRSPLR